MKAEVFNIKREKIGSIELPNFVFGAEWNRVLVHQVILAFQSNMRNPIAHTKDRSEVRGGGKKPWRQKHTGRSRHGSSRSPIWTGGGVTFGPRNERSFEKKVNKKMRKKALFSVLSKKAKDGEVIIIDNFPTHEQKTKAMQVLIVNFFGSERQKGILFVPGKENKTAVLRMARNINGVSILGVDSLDARSCALPKAIVFEKKAVEELKT